MKNFLIALTVLSISLSACAKKEETHIPEGPVVNDIKELDTGLEPSAQGGQVPTIQVEITLNKSEIFGREFLYGADLQYSNYYDPGYDLSLQSLAIGHIPATFRVAGHELQLVSDNTRLSQSDVNHPEQVITRFKILRQTLKTLTVEGSNARVFLSEVFEGTHTSTQGGLSNPTGPVAKDSWIRSLQFDPKGDYLLQETSIMMPDGSIGEFMEAIFPRENLKPSASFEAFEMDPDHPIGADEGPVARFRFLAGEKNYRGEQAISFAAHFDIGEGRTIDWYATRNTPDNELSSLKAAIEGWNRYYTGFKEIKRDVMRFIGKLPDGIKIGDPRYNVINWDSRLVAGAAYESQAADPATGKQSHSLIYLPAAWTKIGMDYWKNGQFTDSSSSLKSARGIAACMRDLRPIAAHAASGRLATPSEVEKFGKQLLTQTLFHEVGHALGLAHNFKGSLSLDRNEPNSLFSTSIMDYNEFEEERAAFAGVDTAAGPQLEYDRQALSALYNAGRDLDGAAVVPTCNDAEADNEEGGIDPLCVRYDLEKDPTLSIVTAQARIHQPALDRDVTLVQAVARVPGLILTSEAIAAVKTEQEFDALVAKIGASLRGVVRFYIVGSISGLTRTVRENIRMFLIHAEDSLPQGFDAAVMRDRTMQGLQELMTLNQIPPNTTNALAGARAAAIAKLIETPFMKSLDPKANDETLKKAEAAITKTVQSLETDENTGFPRARALVLSELGRHETVDFFFEVGVADYEADIIDSLVYTAKDAILATASERLAAAGSLVTYRGRMHGDLAIAGAVKEIEHEREIATNNKMRTMAEKLLAALK